MKSLFSHLRVLLTALILAAGGLLASVGSASAHQQSGDGTYAIAAAVQDAFIAERGIEEIVAETARPDRGCADDSGACCSATQFGCCASFGLCSARSTLPPTDLTCDLPGLPAILGLGSIDPQANRRPPKPLA
ncbi:hypothetical protein WH91_03220 [Devosia psychrophila]|uniref:Uncharacterized protein n=1 Tax=Devosia psychrophila TaxID=728005 RepID=A0ABR5E288_9HYPH|nr:hypothetical protein WH91_03220 [Devosia psychrophila]